MNYNIDQLPREIFYHVLKYTHDIFPLKVNKKLNSFVVAYLNSLRNQDSTSYAQKINYHQIRQGLQNHNRSLKDSVLLTRPVIINSHTQIGNHKDHGVIRSADSTHFMFKITPSNKKIITPFPQTLPFIKSDEIQAITHSIATNEVSAYDQKILDGNEPMSTHKDSFTNISCFANNQEYLYTENGHLVLNIKHNGRFLIFDQNQHCYFEGTTLYFLFTYQNKVIYHPLDEMTILDTETRESQNLKLNGIMIATYDTLQEHIAFAGSSNHSINESELFVYNFKTLELIIQKKFDFPIKTLKYLNENFLFINKEKIFELSSETFLDYSINPVSRLIPPLIRFSCNGTSFVAPNYTEKNLYDIECFNLVEKSIKKIAFSYSEPPAIHLSQDRIICCSKKPKHQINIFDFEGKEIPAHISKNATFFKIYHHILFYFVRSQKIKLVAIDLENGKRLWKKDMHKRTAFQIHNGYLIQAYTSEDMKKLNLKVTSLRK